MIKDVVQHMHAVAQLAGNTRAPHVETTAAPGGFAAELQRSIARISAAQEAANTQAQAFELGAPGIELSDVMIDMQKASIAFQTAVQVRNRLVSAYQEIASMPV